MDMIFALLDVVLACQVPFGMPQYIQCMHNLFLFVVQSCDPGDGLLVADYCIHNGKIWIGFRGAFALFFACYRWNIAENRQIASSPHYG